MVSPGPPKETGKFYVLYIQCRLFSETGQSNDYADLCELLNNANIVLPDISKSSIREFKTKPKTICETKPMVHKYYLDKSISF